MGKNLRPEIVAFFCSKMREHSKVARCFDLEADDNFVFLVERKGGLSDVRIWLNDDYHFTEYSYLNKPRTIVSGDFILVTRPEASATDSAVAVAGADGVGVGKIGHLMGALHSMDLLDYEDPDRRRGRAS